MQSIRKFTSTVSQPFRQYLKFSTTPSNPIRAGFKDPNAYLSRPILKAKIEQEVGAILRAKGFMKPKCRDWVAEIA